MTMLDTASITEPPGSNVFASPEELRRQLALFADVTMTGHLLDAMPGIVLVLNRHRQIVFANRAFVQLVDGGGDGPHVGKFVGDVLSCHVALDSASGCGSGDACETCGVLLSMISGGNGETNVQECTLTRQLGVAVQNLTLRVWSAPLDYHGETFIVMAGMDISHERRRLALERTFFHDILNLVGSIRGFAELMEIDESVDPLAVSRRIQMAAQRVIDEIDAQRLLLAVEKGELKVDNHVLVSREVLNDILVLYEGQEVARRRQLWISAAAAEVSFVSDVTLLRRILGNMAKNALEASAEGDTVTLGVDAEGPRLHFWVHNQASIPTIHHQRIFQRDFSTKGAGRGLGTYSMRILAHFLAGAVSFDSSPENGTRFTLSLPTQQRAGA